VKSKKPKLSKRMLLFLEQAIKHKPLWDICCDHGFVGLGALRDQFSEVHFVDQVPHIMDTLRTRLEQYPPKTDCKFSLHVIPAELIDQDIFGTCLIAGVGGLTIKNILSALIVNQKLKAQRLLLSPHTDELVLVDFISELSFQEKYSLKEKYLFTEGKKERSLYILDLI
jgi:tRNA (adenine22-N1)-methyltransferase